jgi:hypothetical protein
MDDFTSYGTDGGNAARLLNGPYAEASAVTLQADPDPTAGGKFVLNGGNGGAVRRVLSSPQTVVGMAGRFWPINLSGETVFMSVSDTNNVLLCWVAFDASGYIKAYRSDTAGFVLLGTSANPVMIANAWQHMETKFVMDATSGSIQVRREGVTVLNVTGVRTTTDKVGALATIQNTVLYRDAGWPLVAVNHYVKDYIVWDGSSTVNNDFFGACQVYKLQPASDVARNWGTQQAAAPVANTPTTSTTGGTLAAGTYFYVVTAILSTGETVASNEVSITTTGTTSSNTITWTAPLGMTVTGYRVYRGTSTGAENVFYAPGNVLTFTDTNAASTGGTPPTDTGTGWNKINDLTPDDDTTFITAASPPPSPYQAALTQLPANVTSVRAVMTMHRSRKTDGGDGFLQASLLSGANTGLGANRAITTAYTYWSDMFDQDPSGVNWSKTLVNALNLKLNRTT